MRTFISIALLAGLSACGGEQAYAPAYWQKENATQLDFDQDHYDCIIESQTTYTILGPRQVHARRDPNAPINRVVLNACMAARGYTPAGSRTTFRQLETNSR